MLPKRISPAPAASHPAVDRDAGTQAARRMTRALNLIEAKGYGDFKDFRADGRNFDASVSAQGRSVTVTVDPDTGQVTQQG